MPRNHIVIIDGTQSKLDADHETNAGILYKLLKEANDKETRTLVYDPGVQGHGLWNWVTIASGWGINQSIKDAFDILSSRYKDGDRIYLFGFSRGAYAVRSVAGMISRIGLLRANRATARNLRQAFRLYETEGAPDIVSDFRTANCHPHVEIEMIGVWDTVKALGIDYPILSHLAPMATEFHDDQISDVTKFGFQALALDERRLAFSPVLWTVPDNWQGEMEQVWFNGAHSDIGGNVWKFPQSRPLANIPLCWMLRRVAKCGLKLPADWPSRFPTDPTAPAFGDRRGLAKFFLFRSPRTVGEFPNEYLHESAVDTRQPDKFTIPVAD